MITQTSYVKRYIVSSTFRKYKLNPSILTITKQKIKKKIKRSLKSKENKLYLHKQQTPNPEAHVPADAPPETKILN